MCGRFTLYTHPNVLAELFGLPLVPPLAPRYNIAPTQPVAIVRPGRQPDTREWALVRWGLVPSWAKDPTIGVRMINARSETVAEKPSFRAAYKRRRCLVPADGFYEWQKIGSRKQPHYIHLRDNEAFAIAGLWEHWHGPDGSELETCTLLTTEPNDLMASLHNRMPVMIAPEDYEEWLDNRREDRQFLSIIQHLLRPYPSDQMASYPVSTYVSNTRNEGPECIERQ